VPAARTESKRKAHEPDPGAIERTVREMGYDAAEERIQRNVNQSTWPAPIGWSGVNVSA
jgi:hypothetical protein